MNDNYAVINGKRVELTDEQLKALGIKKTNPFERVETHDYYYYVRDDNRVDVYTDINDMVDKAMYNVSNYFNDRDFAHQVALHQLLYRKLLKFTYGIGCEDNQEWDGANRHWCIRYDHCDKVFDVTWYDTFQPSSVYFSTMESAERAIEEVVEPFMKEHPDFVW